MTRFFRKLAGSRKAVTNHAAAQSAAAETAQARKGCKVLVVCKGQVFSNNVMDYAIDMAARTRSGLVALNLDEHGHDFKGFRAQAEQNIEQFSARAADAGLSFCHEVRQGVEDAVVARMYEEDSEFRYVMDDVAAASTPSKTIPVYTRATLRAS